MLDLATTLGSRYRIEARLGGGGMADVFEAYDEGLNRPVAVKLLRGIDDAAAARRFAEEIRLTARLNHPNVVRLFDAGEHEGSPYLVLERVVGGTLAQRMDAGALDPHRVAMIGAQLASALAYAHDQGVIHRDVKPSNVLLTADETVRLADFGIALTATATRLTVAGSVAGSAGYVSPEQVLGTGTGTASDVYALGLVLLECLTGAPPWTGTTVEVALARIASDPPIPATFGDDWQRLLLGMTARRPEDRPPMAAVAFGLQQLAADRPLPADVAPLIVAERPPRGRKAVLAGVAAALLLGAGVAALTLPSRNAVADSPNTNNLIAGAVLQGAAVPPAAAQAPATAPDEPVEDRRTRKKGRSKAEDGARTEAAVDTGKAEAPTVEQAVDTATRSVPIEAPRASNPAPAARDDVAPARREERVVGDDADDDDDAEDDAGDDDADADVEPTDEDDTATRDDTGARDKDRVKVPQRGRSSADVPGLARGLQ